jgi:phosphonate transport system substrate-binding protein
LVLLLLPLPIVVAAGELVLGVHPYLQASTLMERFTPLATYLSRAVGTDVRVRVGTSYRDHVLAVGRGKVDIAFLGPAPYVHLTREFGQFPLLGRFGFDGKRGYRGVIVVPVASEVTSIPQLAGKRMAFGDPLSTMSSLVPRYLIQQEGVSLPELDKHVFLNNHHNVALGVLMGRYDAGAMKEEVFREYEQRGLRALAWSPEISSHLFVANPALPEPLVGKIRAAMLNLHTTPEGAEILRSIKKGTTLVAPVTDGDYDNLRRLLETIGEL